MKPRAVAIAVCALAAAGCGGAGPQASTTSGSATGLAAQPAARILAATEAAIDGVHSFHLVAASTVAGKALSVSSDFVLPGRARIVIRDGAGTIELRAINGAIYYRANRPYYRAEGVTGAGLAVSGRWVSATPAELPTIGAFLALTDPATLGRCLLGQRLGTLSVGGYASVGGRRAVVVVDAGDRPGSAPGRLYVAASGPPLPLRLTTSGPHSSGGSSDPACDDTSISTPTTATNTVETISRINAPTTIAIPAQAVSMASLTSPARATNGVAAASVQTAQTKHGAVAYRIIGSGSPLVLITGYGGTMESWDPRFVDALARHHRVVIFDNAGVGDTQALPAPLTIDAMADQTSALIGDLGLGRPNVLGWSMGGMVAQALAIRHPAQVRRLVLCATFPGSGSVARPSQAAINALNNGNEQQVLADLFPADQATAASAFASATSSYPTATSASAAIVSAQAQAIRQWWADRDPAGQQTARISVPTLVADGTLDRLDPASNSHALAKLIVGARLVLYPDAGHAFLFQDQAAFVPLIDSFLG